MSKSIPNVDWANQLESVIRQFVKEKLELIMREEIKHFLEIEQAGTSNMRNGYYQRNLDTQYGRIEGLLCFLQAKSAENCKKKYIGLPAQ